MRGGWVAGLTELSVYLFGFTVTGRLVARKFDPGDQDRLLAAFACAALWPLVAVVLGACKLLARLFGIER